MLLDHNRACPAAGPQALWGIPTEHECVRNHPRGQPATVLPPLAAEFLELLHIDRPAFVFVDLVDNPRDVIGGDSVLTPGSGATSL